MAATEVRLSEPGDRSLTFERIEIRRAPGFERRGFRLEEISPGINLVLGPQAAGKSTVARFVEWLLWPSGRSWRERSVAARVRLGGEVWEVDADHGRPRYQRDGQPEERLPTPGSDLADRYSLSLHDLLQAGADDRAFAHLIAREIAGGFDLQRALDAVGAQERGRRLRNPVRDLEEAHGAVRSAREEQAELDRRQRQLDRLRDALSEAESADRRKEEIERVLEVRLRRERLEVETRALEALPDALEHLGGGEGETLQNLDTEIADLERDLAETETRARRAEGELARAALPAGGLPPALLETLRRRHEALGKLASRIAESDSVLAGLRRRRDDAAARLGRRGVEDELKEADPREAGPSGTRPSEARRGGAGPAEPLRDEPAPGASRLRAFGGAGWEAFTDFAERSERWRARSAHLSEELERLGRPAEGADGERPEEAEILRQGIGRLRRWLRSGSGGRRGAAVGLVAALALAAGAAAAALTVDPRGWFLAAFGGLLAAWAVVEIGRAGSARHGAEREYRGLGLEEPERWQPEPVEALLRGLETRLHDTLAAMERAARRARLSERRRRLEAEGEELRALRAELLERAGVAPKLVADLDAAPLAAFVGDLGAWREADAEVRDREARLDRWRAEGDDILRQAAEALRPFGGEPPRDADALGGLLDDLEARERVRAAAQEVLDTALGAGGRVEGLRRKLDTVRKKREDLFETLGLPPGDRAGLRRLLDELPAYREQVERVRDARAALDERQGDLPDEERLGDLLDRPEAELRALRDELAERAAGGVDLRREIDVTEDRIEQARARHAVEDALVRLDAAREGLRAERERDADGVVADELGRWLREQLSGRRRPAVMERAALLFRRFTRGRFTLIDPTGDAPELRALETGSGLGRALSELSSGTRLQLLLAVRLGFIEDQERGTRLPLVLDETLANSDDWAADAIIAAVLDLARAGRQVFYFTAQRDEIAKWRDALEEGDGPDWTLLDLARIRSLEERRDRPFRAVATARHEPPPSPAGMSPVEYARALGVPGLDPRAGVGAVHLWYLVEGLEPLRALLARDLVRWGQLDALGEAPARELLAGAGAPADAWDRVVARARCLDTLFDGWRIGRGEPVDREVLRSSGAVAEETFLDPVSSLAADLDGAAGALLAALRERSDDRAKGFRAQKAADLEAFLLDSGHLDPRPVLVRAALRDRALGALGPEIAAGSLRASTIDRFLDELPDLP